MGEDKAYDIRLENTGGAAVDLEACRVARTTRCPERKRRPALGGAPNVDFLSETYYSVTPFCYGAYIAKFSVVPIASGLTANRN